MTRKGSPDTGSSGPIDWQGPGARPAAPSDDPAEADVTADGAPDGGADDSAGDAASDDVVAADADAEQAESDSDGPDAAVTDLDEAAATDGADDDAPRSVEAERDDYLDRLQRLQAEFDNYRKRMTREQGEALNRGSQALAAELLPVLDGCEAAVQQGQAEVEPIRNQLVELLTKAGLERTGEPGDAFDPELHDAVMHEPAEDGQDGSVIAEVLRTGYSWKGRVLRPAMVKVRG